MDNLGCFHLSTIVISAAMHIHEQVFVWTPVFDSFWYILRIGVSESYGNFLFN